MVINNANKGWIKIDLITISHLNSNTHHGLINVQLSQSRIHMSHKVALQSQWSQTLVYATIILLLNPLCNMVSYFSEKPRVGCLRVHVKIYRKMGKPSHSHQVKSSGC